MKADPPKIFASQGPAVLVNLDGEAIWSPIKDNDLKFAVNTNWDLFQHEATKTFYLRNENTWLKAADLAGAWGPAGQLPGSFAKLPADENWKDVKAALPGQKLTTAPKVFVSTTPAELILLTGPPKYEPVAGTSLLWVSNTEADVFRAGKTGLVYFLVSGRWFSSPGFEGPWTFATLTLPADFQKISLEHPRSRVLASVPGTQQAAEAVLLAQVPQTARVNKKELKAPDVAYQGEPKFEPIEKTQLSARRQHRQGHHQVRRPLLHVLPGRVVRVQGADGPVGGHLLGAEGDLRDPGELAGAQRDVRDGGRGR